MSDDEGNHAPRLSGLSSMLAAFAKHSASAAAGSAVSSSSSAAGAQEGAPSRKRDRPDRPSFPVRGGGSGRGGGRGGGGGGGSWDGGRGGFARGGGRGGGGNSFPVRGRGRGGSFAPQSSQGGGGRDTNFRGAFHAPQHKKVRPADEGEEKEKVDGEKGEGDAVSAKEASSSSSSSAAAPRHGGPAAAGGGGASHHRRPPSPPSTEPLDPCSVFLNGLAFSIISEKDVEEPLKKYGAIKHARVAVKDGVGQGYGFVQFETPEAASACISGGSVEVGGRPMAPRSCRAALVEKWLAPPPKPIVTSATIMSFRPRAMRGVAPASAAKPPAAAAGGGDGDGSGGGEGAMGVEEENHAAAGATLTMDHEV